MIWVFMNVHQKVAKNFIQTVVHFNLDNLMNNNLNLNWKQNIVELIKKINIGQLKIQNFHWIIQWYYILKKGHMLRTVLLSQTSLF